MCQDSSVAEYLLCNLHSPHFPNQPEPACNRHKSLLTFAMGHKRRRDYTGAEHEVRASIKRTLRGPRVVPKLVRLPPVFAPPAGRASGATASTSSQSAGLSQLPGASHGSPMPANDPYNDYTSKADAHARQTRSQHDYQGEFLGVRDEYMVHLLAAEGRPTDGGAACGHDAAWRCISCHGRPSFCGPCCLAAHQDHPLHRVERWQGAFYQSAWLRQLGMQIHCGHGGKPCPSLARYSSPFTPNDTNSEVPTAAPPSIVDRFTALFTHGRTAEDDDEEELPLLVEEDLSDCDDEDAAPSAPAADDDEDDRPPGSVLVADLPWIGEPAAPMAGVSQSPPTFSNDRMLVIVDTEGIHELSVTFCACPNAIREDLQLLDLGLYPATKSRPRTAFTMRVLDAFSLASKECNASARNYYNILRRTTNSAFPHMVPDRYRELLRVSRQWRNLKMRKWAGFGHRAEAVGPGDLAVRCPACPQPGVNLPDDWQTDPERWKYARGVVLDGNFSAQHRPMAHPEKDVRLADGHAFTVAEGPYKEHLATGKEYKETTTCNDHRAVLNAAVSHGKYEATGIGAAACSRHGFFQPHACVDFQLGERQINMDYIVNWILAFLNGLTTILVLYDIMCQYFTHLHERFEKSPKLAMPPGLTFLRGIGQFHVHGHLTRCFPRFSLNFLRGVGIQDGEIIETLWNKINGIAGSTRGMGSGHRHEVIDDRMNDSNWMKLTRIVPQLIRRWKRIATESPLAMRAFEELAGSVTPEERVAWEAEARAADEARDRNVEAMDIYDVHSKPAPTQKEVQEALLQEELREQDINAGGETSWIATGLRLEERKLSLAYSARQNERTPTDAARVAITDLRLKLAKAIRVFHAAGRRHVGPSALAADAEDPTLLGEEWDTIGELAATRAKVPVDPMQPELHPLALPSTLGLAYLTQHRLLHLVAKEVQLREGQLNDSLQAIRTGIGYKSMLYRKKVRGATSTRAKLRSFDEVHVADDTIYKHVRVYHQARNAVLRLFDDRNPEGVAACTAFLAKYRPITRADLTASTTVLEAFTPGLRNVPEAWFWSVGANDGGADSSWMHDFRRSLWLRAYARRERWMEERVLVPFEMECTVRYFKKRATDWEGWSRTGSTPGHLAYGQRQADMWRRLATHAEKAFADALATILG
ncbi:hypothetical protein K466DRAFT_38375 [Polyporus arcularius HHB13444]|uniref:CxC2-like cysteine cluster KDZ transposase-associated domain-containing protein n=1 Tax=Polyporus arcularius HHB13444 TaxID=1314778 RepID=A0A5C3PI21_9APHY|nr:hypothetical protein K466DRAFT_38375 [Polyporus arcularius HHB13444]